VASFHDRIIAGDAACTVFLGPARFLLLATLARVLIRAATSIFLAARFLLASCLLLPALLLRALTLFVDFALLLLGAALGVGIISPFCILGAALGLLLGLLALVLSLLALVLSLLALVLSFPTCILLSFPACILLSFPACIFLGLLARRFLFG